MSTKPYFDLPPPARAAEIFIKWVNAGLLQPGKTKGELAKVLGVDATIAGRITSGKRKIYAEELPLISRYLGQPIPGQIAILTTPQKTVPIIGDIDVNLCYPLDHELGSNAATPETMVPIVLDTGYKKVQQRALRIADDSFDKVAPEGAYVLFVPYWKVRRRLVDGDVVIYRHSEDELAGYFVRRVVQTATGFELVAQATLKSRHRAFYFSKAQANNKELRERRILGKVIFVGFGL